MRIYRHSVLARKDFPIEIRDVLVVRDGSGAIAERWRLDSRAPYDAGRNVLWFVVQEFIRAA